MASSMLHVLYHVCCMLPSNNSRLSSTSGEMAFVPRSADWILHKFCPAGAKTPFLAIAVLSPRLTQCQLMNLCLNNDPPLPTPRPGSVDWGLGLAWGLGGFD